MEKKKLAKIAIVAAALAAGMDTASTNQAVAQVYTPTNLYLFEKCTIVSYPNNYTTFPTIKEGGKCTGTGGNCLSSASCS